MNVLVREGLYDKDYVAAHGFGFETFAAEVAPLHAGVGLPETGIEPDVIRETAREMARHRPATLVHPGRHATWYGDDAQRSRAIALLNALLGSWGRKGGFYQPASMDVPAYPYPPYPKPETGQGRQSRPPLPVRERGHHHRHPRGHDHRQALPGQGLDRLRDEPDPGAAERGRDDQGHPGPRPAGRGGRDPGSEIAGWADVVLPEATYLERYDDLNVELFREPFVALRQPVVEAPHDQKPNWWIARELAVKLGLEAYYPWKTIEEYLESRLKGAGLSLAALQKKGLVRGPRPPIYFEEGVPPQFATPSEKIEFYSLQLKDAGFDPVPSYTAPRRRPAGLLPPALRPRARALVQPHRRPTRCSPRRWTRTRSG